mgnify:CR=1 FL=1
MIWFFAACVFDKPCAFLYGAAKDECHADLALDLYPKDPEQSQILLNKIEDPLILDFVLLELSRQFHPKDTTRCTRIKDNDLRHRCLTFTKRPHLERGYKEK